MKIEGEGTFVSLLTHHIMKADTDTPCLHLCPLQCHLLHPQDGDSMALQNAGNLPHHHMVS